LTNGPQYKQLSITVHCVNTIIELISNLRKFPM